MKKPIVEFVRNLTAEKEDKVVKIITQPYCVGLYVCITDPDAYPNPIQLGLAWEESTRWFNKLIKKMESSNYKVAVDKRPISDFLSKEEIDNYVNYP